MCACLFSLAALGACHQGASEKTPDPRDAARASASTAASTSAAPPLPPRPGYIPTPLGTPAVSTTAQGPEKVDFQDVAMGTNVHMIAYSNPHVDAEHIKIAINDALLEMRRLEGLMSEWHDDSEVGKINANPDQWVNVGPETFAVISRALDEGKASGGAFDITFQAMSNIWKFGSAAEAQPKLPSPAEIAQRRKLVDYRTVELDPKTLAVRIPKDHKIGLGGIAKGYIVDRAVDVLKKAGIQTFLVQAGGDLFGAGRKPDGSAWISGIQDPRQVEGVSFATIELTDHAFSTAGDYARSYIIGKRRYHHIIDPHTGYPATASRSVTVWADDATTADAIDDAVFILGPEKGLKLVEATPGVGVVIVDKNNKVWISPRLEGKVRVTRQPTDGI
ncbi:MAG TPA: FAD:protein FMN transferase [Polyangiaceae bacterium]|nr:FAD:protein FMN transferase [Polyangiaceae bacterium]